MLPQLRDTIPRPLIHPAKPPRMPVLDLLVLLQFLLPQLGKIQEMEC
jgi:hypothetical protein